MAKNKKTKVALITGLLSMVTCVAMVVGSTFAWFTDTATASVTNIVSGNLDIKLQRNVDGTWTDIVESGKDGETVLQWKSADTTKTDVLWEPGCTYNLEPIKVVNSGDLAVKYTIVINNTKGSNATEEPYDLLDVLHFSVMAKESETADPAPIELDKFEDTLTPGQSGKEIILVATMDSTANNNYQGLTADDISITIYATQATHEFDSTTDKYDENAKNPTVVASEEGLKGALEKGGKVTLTEDVSSSDGVQFGITADTEIDFGGNTLEGALESGSISDPNEDTNVTLSDPNNDGTKYSIDGEIVLGEGGGMTQFAGVQVWKPTTTIESGRYTHDNAVVHCYLQKNLGPADGGWDGIVRDYTGVVINGGTFDGKGAASVVAAVIGTVEIHGGTFNAHKDGDYSGECVYLSYGSEQITSKVIITGGNFNAEVRIFNIERNEDYVQAIEVSGGTFKVAEGGQLVEGSAEGVLVITGGTFNVDPSAYVDTANYNVTGSVVEGVTWYTVTAK